MNKTTVDTPTDYGQPLEPGFNNEFDKSLSNAFTNPKDSLQDAKIEGEKRHNISQADDIGRQIQYQRDRLIDNNKQKLNDEYLLRTNKKNAAITKSIAAYTPRKMGGKYSRIKRKGMRKSRAKSRKNYRKNYRKYYRKNSKKHYKRR